MQQGIVLDKVSFSYKKETKVLRNISLEISRGDFLGISGTNGSGKSTLSLLLNGLIPHFIEGELSGQVLVEGVSTTQKNVSYFAQRVGMVFQNPDLSLFNLTVSEEIEFGLKNFGLDNIEKRKKEALSLVGLSGFENRDPQTLSFGEKQKICLACVLALDTQYLVLDEPTAMLDYKNSLELYKLLEKLNQRGKTIITIDHDTDFLWKYCVSTLILDKGGIKLFGETKKVLKNEKVLKTLGIKVPKTFM